MRRPLRVLLGTFEISGFVSDLAHGLSRCGVEVTTAIRYGLSSFASRGYDHVLGDAPDAVDWAALARDDRGASRVTRRMRRLIDDHDVFVFVYASLWPDARGGPGDWGVGRELPLLRRLGKRSAVLFTGPDARHAPALDQELRRLGGHDLPIARVVPAWGARSIEQPLRNVRRAELYADAVFSQPNQAGLALRPYAHLHAPLRLRAVRPHLPDRAVPRVVHAPSVAAIKGTRRIEAALDRLRARGVRFEYVRLQGVSNAAVLAALRDADVLLDQLHLPMHGRLAVEAMASGCAVATADRADLEPLPPDRPVWPITPADLDAQLERLLGDRALRAALARRGLDHAARWHDHRAVARAILDAVERPDAALDHRPTFFATSFRLRPGEALTRRALALNERAARRWAPAALASLRRRRLIAPIS